MAVRLWKHASKLAEGITEMRTGAEPQTFSNRCNGQVSSSKQDLRTFHSGLTDIVTYTDTDFLLEFSGQIVFGIPDTA